MQLPDIMELLGVRARMKANKRDRLDIMLLSVGIWSGIVLALLALEMKGLYEFIGMVCMLYNVVGLRVIWYTLSVD